MSCSSNQLFQQAVENTKQVSNGFCSGLKAIKKSDHKKIEITDAEKLNGSLDIDSCLKSLYPHDNRWDYALSYDGKVCFLEIHPALDKEISVVCQKLDWLKNWLKNEAVDINALPRMTPTFCWVPSGKNGFLTQSVSMKKIAIKGLSFRNKMILK